ncbi:MAG TPA: transcription termination/antitermination NusG family protein [Thermodesulfobacteriota bacterium]|nr:transcription termination/antitermination NusG family protein [Thermodesulfobacteriota bacterium]
MTPLPDESITIGPHHWYVIQTKPGNEHRVEMNLFNQEMEVFLPLIETYQYQTKQTVRRIKPLFPNYLFARLDLNLHYYKVKYTRGVSKILGSGVQPTPISEKVIQTIKDRIGKNNLVRLEEEWKEGDLVRITSGPFKELIGIFHKKMSDNGRVRILLNLIGVHVSVQIPQWQLKKVA